MAAALVFSQALFLMAPRWRSRRLPPVVIQAMTRSIGGRRRR
jgi:hypothetical protein